VEEKKEKKEKEEKEEKSREKIDFTVEGRGAKLKTKLNFTSGSNGTRRKRTENTHLDNVGRHGGNRMDCWAMREENEKKGIREMIFRESFANSSFMSVKIR
jgi:hypothetical protein